MVWWSRMDESEVLGAVEELKTSLNDVTASSRNDQEKDIVQILKKLSHLPMSIEILKVTQIGKHVNSLRKWGGRVGSKSKSLVKKWKLLLSDSEKTHSHARDQKHHHHLQSHDRKRHHHHHHHHSSCTVGSGLGEGSQPVIYVESDEEEVEDGKRTSKGRHVDCLVEDEFSKALSMPVVSRKPRRSVGSSSGVGACSVGNEAGTRDRSKDSGSSGTLLLGAPLSPDAKAVRKMSRERSPAPVVVARGSSKHKGPEQEQVMISQSKRSRTQVYSGKKTTSGPQVVTSLFDLCMKILIDNIDVIEDVGPGVPYHVLEPLLLKCSALQLMKLEEYNPHLLEDTDKLWEKHVQKDFKEPTLPHGYDWREFYREKLAEREEKLKNLTARIRANNHAREEPVRKVKLASATIKPGRRSGPRAAPFFGRDSRGGFHRPMERPHAGSNLMKRTWKMAKERNHMMTFKLGK